MSKSILILDTPRSCGDCRFCDYIEPIKSSICTADPTRMFKMKVEGAIYSILVDERCPLRSLPAKTGQSASCKDIAEACRLGWDMCIDTITGDADADN